MKTLFLAFAFLFTSCAIKTSVKLPKVPVLAEKTTNRELWLGRSGDELLLHPIFASLPMESRVTTTKVEVRSFKNSGGTVSNQSCSISSYYSKGYGSGSGFCSDSRLEIMCNHIFYIQNNRISDYKKVGQCYGDRVDFRPYDEDGTPIFTDAELKYVEELTAYNEAVEGGKPCNSTSECSDGMSCSQNKCQSLGLWGRIVNP